MLKRDFNKIKKVVKHKNNNIEHIQPIHRLIGLFKTKWDGNPLIDECYNELIVLEKELIEKLHEIKKN